MNKTIKILDKDTVFELSSDDFCCTVPAEPLRKLAINFNSKTGEFFEYHCNRINCCYDDTVYKFTIYTILDDQIVINIYDNFDLDDVAEIVYEKVKYNLSNYFGENTYKNLSKRSNYINAPEGKKYKIYSCDYEFGSKIEAIIEARGRHKTFVSNLSHMTIAKVLFNNFKPNYSFKISTSSLLILSK